MADHVDDAKKKKRLRRKAVTASDTKRRQKDWSKAHSRMTICVEHVRWNRVKEDNALKKNEDVARVLLDHWFSRTQELHPDPGPSGESAQTSMPTAQPTRPVILTPVSSSGVLHQPPEVSDIEYHGYSDSGSLSGIEQLEKQSHPDKSVLSTYMKKAHEAEGSFIKIDFSTEEEESFRLKRDPSFVPDEEHDEEDEEYDEDEDFELNMSLCMPENVEDQTRSLPVAAADEILYDFIRGDKNDEDEDGPNDDDMNGRDRNYVTEKKQRTSSSHMEFPAIQETSVCGKFLASCALLTSGNNYAKVAMMASFINLGFPGYSSHYRVQRVFAAPTINRFYTDLIHTNRDRHKDKEVVLAGDGRNDSPGHSAMYCTYTMLEFETEDVLACEIVDKRMVQQKSTNMEKEALLRAINNIQNHGLTIKEVCTDAHTQIAAMLRHDVPDVKHSLHTWHGAKNFGKKLGALAAEARYRELKPWVRDLVNHFWYCSRKADGSEMALIARWKGMLHHVVNSHQWIFGVDAGPAECEHGPLAEDEESKWPDSGSPPHEPLAKVILDTRLLHTLKHYVNFRHW